MSFKAPRLQTLDVVAKGHCIPLVSERSLGPGLTSIK